jgi:hypothetical protein
MKLAATNNLNGKVTIINSLISLLTANAFEALSPNNLLTSFLIRISAVATIVPRVILTF